MNLSQTIAKQSLKRIDSECVFLVFYTLTFLGQFIDKVLLGCRWIETRNKFQPNLPFLEPKRFGINFSFTGTGTGIPNRGGVEDTRLEAQGQGHKKNPWPRPRTAFPRTDTLEAKDRNAQG